MLEDVPEENGVVPAELGAIQLLEVADPHPVADLHRLAGGVGVEFGAVDDAPRLHEPAGQGGGGDTAPEDPGARSGVAQHLPPEEPVAPPGGLPKLDVAAV